MKYSEYRQKKKFTGSTAFYMIIACCLLSIGGAAWFAASGIKSREAGKGSSSNPSTSDYINSESEISFPSVDEPTEPVQKPVQNEPYTSSNSSKEETATKPAVTVYSMPVQGEIIKDYSETELKYSATYGDMRLHSGIDIACEDSTQVSAAGDGKVLTIEETASNGTVISIEHTNGIVTRYTAIKDIKVKKGDAVSVGDIIGSVTTIPSECGDQSHLHFEVFKNGHSADPLKTLGLK